ncbi:MAG TPA: hypothetical protein VF723_02195, partial [Pyrinomonadaceae bacterium]
MSTGFKFALLSLLLIVSASTTISIIHSQQTQDTASRKSTTDDEDVPITDFNKPLPTDPKERDKRQQRSRRGNIKLGPETGVFDPKRFMLTEERESSYGGFRTHAPPEPAIPAATSDAVITGEITKAEAFLTED